MWRDSFMKNYRFQFVERAVYFLKRALHTLCRRKQSYKSLRELRSCTVPCFSMYKRALYVRKWALHTLCHGTRSLQISPWTAILCICMFQQVWKRALYVRRRALQDLCRGKRSLQISSRTAIMCIFMIECVYRAVHVRKRVHDTFRFPSYWAHQSFICACHCARDSFMRRSYIHFSQQSPTPPHMHSIFMHMSLTFPQTSRIFPQKRHVFPQKRHTFQHWRHIFPQEKHVFPPKSRRCFKKRHGQFG